MKLLHKYEYESRDIDNEVTGLMLLHEEVLYLKNDSGA
jgi:hypothetical protein